MPTTGLIHIYIYIYIYIYIQHNFGIKKREQGLCTSRGPIRK